ncbi:MAG: CpsD/CapB family tyrosine-protein kinase [Armatimonadota bacterium]|nr:CpsD/CapB family tyrosine-protein kinase [Armatimonadota bacterium]MDR7452270.1 CpsD/CapB family tyrosine-protein kinase [Armatimonadota bacterium]MDR7467966.1 CpsD/CapB family tyrosine-protein kinase [Armatimonadota bacterium]MDR7494808.1 CpsD/CapB family tyrosine-protein kinase [Armatimonadota bacterium]MDR7499238.1 CpsD/CapB family tyrosine-protein kinase [Armatimonadota bacterium]
MVQTKKPRGDLITAYGEVSPFAEAYRTLRISLLQGNGKAPWSVGITGIHPAHGATTTVANLGLITAETGTRVVLMDADLYKPSLHRVLDVPGAPGLSAVLEGGARLNETLYAVSGAPQVRVLPAGPRVRNPAALLRPHRLTELLHELREWCDFLVVDLPSVGAVAYASLLASFLDGVVLVIRADTPRMDVEQTVKRRLQNANVLGMVLNRVPVSSGDSAGYRYYSRDLS